jgi:predicted RNase H-like HicB family nuclease
LKRPGYLSIIVHGSIAGREEYMKLHITIEKDESGFFVAEVPALPGCLSQGRTSDEAISNIKEAIEGWLEVMEAKVVPQLSEFIEVTV